jgi:hypothetical protein
MRIKTAFGIFNSKWTDDNFLSLGGSKWCVQIHRVDAVTANLEWLGTDNGGCEVSGLEIHGDKTLQMFYLALTIYKQKYPDTTILSLTDSSKKVCNLKWPKHVEKSVGIMKLNLLLYGQTYYQRKLNAIPQNEEQYTIVKQFQKNRSDPSFKPAFFSFQNAELQKILQPMYERHLTWASFFEEFRQHFIQNDICAYMYTWHLYAFQTIQQNEITSHWKIDITQLPYIEYTILQNGGTRKKSCTIIKYLKEESFFVGLDNYTIPFLKMYRKTYR